MAKKIKTKERETLQAMLDRVIKQKPKARKHYVFHYGDIGYKVCILKDNDYTLITPMYSYETMCAVLYNILIGRKI